MATETAYSGNPFEVPDKRRGGTTSKRKRDSLDNVASLGRAAPNTRRASAQNAAQQQGGSALTNPTPAIADMGATGFPSTNGGNDDPAQFDFSLQQPGGEVGLGHGAPGQDSGNVDTAAAALNQHYNMQVPRDDNFGGQSGNDADDGAFNLDDSTAFPELEGDGIDGPGGRKPPVGSEEWHKVRKDNHKEVERRRRETINEGINELAKIVPNCEKNKGAVLQRAVQYIAKLQDEATQNIDKWTFEKLVTEQAINDLSSKLARAWAEKEAWKRIAREAGVDVETVDLGLGAAEEGAGGVVAAAVTGGAQTQGQQGSTASAVQAAAQAVENQATTAQMQGSGSSIPADAIDTQLDAK